MHNYLFQTQTSRHNMSNTITPTHFCVPPPLMCINLNTQYLRFTWLYSSILFIVRTAISPLLYICLHIGSLPSIAYRLSSIAYRLSSIIYRLSSIVYRLSSIVYRLSSIVYRLSSIVYRLSSIVYRLSSIESLCLLTG